MGNFTKIERSLNNIEKHLKTIADSMNSQQDIQVLNTVNNLYHGMDEVVLVEAEKKFTGLSVTVYMKDIDQSDNELLDKLEELEKTVRSEHPNTNITISYTPVSQNSI